MSENIFTEESKAPAPRQQKVIRPISFSPLRLFADLAELIQYRDLINFKTKENLHEHD